MSSLRVALEAVEARVRGKLLPRVSLSYTRLPLTETSDADTAISMNW